MHDLFRYINLKSMSNCNVLAISKKKKRSSLMIQYFQIVCCVTTRLKKKSAIFIFIFSVSFFHLIFLSHRLPLLPQGWCREEVECQAASFSFVANSQGQQETVCLLQNGTQANNPTAKPIRALNQYYMVKMSIRSGKNV